jgi:hypothetical protein
MPSDGGGKDTMMKVYVPRTRKEIEHKLRVWGIKHIQGLPLRDLSKDQLIREYCRQYRRIRREQQVLAESRRRLKL